MDLLRQAAIMGMDLGHPRAVILLDLHSELDGRATAVRDGAEAVIRRVVHFFHLPSDTICGNLVVVKARSSKVVAAAATWHLGRTRRTGSARPARRRPTWRR